MTVEHVPHPQGLVWFGTFGGGGVVAYTPPADTTDPRYDACIDHHVACDCREAQWAEYRSEVIADRRELQKACDRILTGHPTRTYTNQPPCQCTGCQIARAAHIYPRSNL